MALPALKFEMETPLEERVARLEANVEHIQKDVADVEKQFTTVEKSFAALHTARAFDRVWWLLMSGALLGVMARAFKWI